MFCTKCGQQIDDGAVFCTRCGNGLQGVPQQPQTPAASAYPGYYAQGYAAPQPKKSHKGLAISLSVGAGVLAILMVVLFVFILPGGNITGKWYEQTGTGGTIEFLKDGTVNYEAMGFSVTGEYTYNAGAKSGQMTIEIMGVSGGIDFELQGNMLVIEGAYYTRDYVEQQNLSDMLDDFGLDGSALDGLDMSQFNADYYDMGDLGDWDMGNFTN